MYTKRYLTDLEKSNELASIDPHMLDPSMADYIDALNAIDGVCTLQSCAGHRRIHDEDVDVENGGLWIWMSESLMREFRAEVFTLVDHPNIEAVRTLYQPYGAEVVEISFKGRSTPPLTDNFEQSMDFIVSWMRELATSAAG